MTSYDSEQDYLKDQVYSNTLAIRYLQQKLEMIGDELLPDYMGTEQKVIGVLEEGIQSLKEESKEMRRRIKELNAEDDL